MEILKYVESLNSEINLLQQELDQQKSERQAHALPPHLRRRSTSHNWKRFPSRVRAHISKESVPPKKKMPSTKHRRRPKNQSLAFSLRTHSGKWLETHVWHAKRFFMETLWGWRIPLHPTIKCMRSAIKSATSSAFLVDISYYKCLELKGPRSSLIAGLTLLVPPNSQLYKEDNKEASFVLYHPGRFPFGAMGPVHCVWCPINQGDQATVWIWTHPSLEEELVTELQTVLPNASLSFPELVRHRLVGPKAPSIVASLLQVKRTSILPSQPGAVLGLRAKDPRLIAPSDREQLGLGKNYKIIEDHSLWDLAARESAIKNKLQDHIICKLRSQLLIPGETLEITKDLVDIPIQVVKLSHLDGFDLVYPKGWGMPFWIALVFSGARAFGLRDHKRISSVFFPDHFPDSAAGQAYHAATTKKLLDKFQRLPPGKKPNFDLLGIKNPYSYCWEDFFSSNCFYVLREKMTLRNLQFFLDGQDVSLPQEDCLVPVRLQALGKGTLEAYATILLENNTKIGYVLDGEFSQARGTVTGLGFVTLSGLVSLTKPAKVFVKLQHATVNRPFTIEIIV